MTDFALALQIIVVVETDTSVPEHEKVLHCVLRECRCELTFFYFLLISEIDDLVEESALWVGDLITLDARNIVSCELLDNISNKLLVFLLRLVVFGESEVPSLPSIRKYGQATSLFERAGVLFHVDTDVLDVALCPLTGFHFRFNHITSSLQQRVCVMLRLLFRMVKACESETNRFC